MTRRETIIIAALINACLLVVLFLCSLHADQKLERLATQDPFLPQEEIKAVSRLPISEPLLNAPDSANRVSVSFPDKPSRFHQVHLGEELESIAKSYQVTPGELMEINELSSTTLTPGQRLRLPPSAQPPVVLGHTVEKPLSEEKIHYVQRGENPWMIAKKYSMTLDQLLELNKLDEQSARRLREGDRLRVK